MKKMAAAAMLTMAMMVSACGAGGTEGGTSPVGHGTAAASASIPAGNHKILIAYFSYGENAGHSDNADVTASASVQHGSRGVTGNTGLIAEDIAKVSGGTLYSIKTVQPYSPNYNEAAAAGKQEQQQHARPALQGEVPDMAGYDVVFLGYPNWWGDMPMAMYTFLDKYDLAGKTVIPFCTSGGSELSDTVEAIRKAEPSAKVLDGFHVSGSAAPGAEPQVEGWVRSLGLARE